jgi:tetratricopeptide (TPR) repeat protein
MNMNNWLLIGLTLAWTGAAALAQSDFAQFIANRTLQVEAQQLEIDGKYKKAAKQYLKLAKRTQDQKNRAGWTLHAADCLFSANKSHRALEIYKDLMANSPFFVPYEHVVGKLREIAERFVDGNGTFLGLRDRDTAIAIYELIIREVPAIHVSLNDRLRLAELLKLAGRPEEAANAYQAALKLDPGLDDVRLEMALLLAELSRAGDGDGTKLRAAVRHAQAVKDRQPNHPRAKEIDLLLRDAREQDAQRLLGLGQFYLRPSHQRHGAARRYLLDVLRDYPDTQAGWEAKKILNDNPALREAPPAVTAPMP